MVSSESQGKTFLSTVTPDFGHFEERKTRQMAEGTEAAGSNTEAVSPFSVPRDEENSDIHKGQGMPKPGLWLPVFPSGQQRVAELTQRSEGLSKQSPSSQCPCSSIGYVQTKTSGEVT